jgi:hypothetical protein
MAFNFGFGTSESSGTGRSGTGFDVDRYNQFLKAIHETLGGPFTVGDLFQLAPRSQDLFTGEPTGPARPGGGFNLGFGTPPSYGGAGAPTPGPTAAGPNAPAPPAPGGGGTTPAPAPGNMFTQADIMGAWNDDPEKRMDVPRFFRQSGLDPDGFTLDEFEEAVGRVKKFGFTGRSAGNFGKALSLLQNRGANAGAFGGGKGSGVF